MRKEVKPTLQPSVEWPGCGECAYFRRGKPAKTIRRFKSCMKPKSYPPCGAGMVYKEKK